MPESKPGEPHTGSHAEPELPRRDTLLKWKCDFHSKTQCFQPLIGVVQPTHLQSTLKREAPGAQGRISLLKLSHFFLGGPGQLSTTEVELTTVQASCRRETRLRSSVATTPRSIAPVGNTGTLYWQRAGWRESVGLVTFSHREVVQPSSLSQVSGVESLLGDKRFY